MGTCSGNFGVRAEYVSGDAKQKRSCAVAAQSEGQQKKYTFCIYIQKAKQSNCIRRGLLFCRRISDFNNTYKWNENKSISCISKETHILQANPNNSIW